MSLTKEELGRILGRGDGDAALHLLPCSIAHNGPANVSAYFTSKNTGSSADGMEVMEAAFRGRKLLGSKLPLPPDHRGLVLEKQSSKASGDADHVRSKFSDITYWNHDTMPSSSDSLPRCLDWLNISSAIHRSVTAEQVASVLSTEEVTASKRKAAEQ